MLGHRGCRCDHLSESLELQVRAIIDAAIECHKPNVKVIT